MTRLTTTEEETLLHQDDVAKILNVRSATLSMWRLRGVGPRFVKFPAGVRYRRLDVEAYLTERTVTPRRRAVGKVRPVAGAGK
jgi:hypothetical protein